MDNWIDLTVEINEDYLVYPGDENLVLKWDKTIKDSGYNLSRINLNMHLGTHIDFKKHCLDVNDSPMFSKFIGEANVLKIATTDNLIKTETVKNAYNKVNNKYSTLIFDFNHSRFLNSKKYYNVPKFEPSILNFFKVNKIKLIGADLPSFEYENGELLKMHLDLFENNIYLIENLTNLVKLKSQIYLIALPLKIKNIEASIVRAIARNI